MSNYCPVEEYKPFKVLHLKIKNRPVEYIPVYGRHNPSTHLPKPFCSRLQVIPHAFSVY